MERLTYLNDSLLLLGRLRRQLEENGAAYRQDMPPVLHKEYLAGNETALETCRQLEEHLRNLQEEETLRMLSGL